MAQRMDSIVFYRSFFEALQVFQDAGERGFMYDTILEYAFNGTEPPELTPVQTAIFTLIKPQLDANVKKSENGKKGGRPRKETTENEKPQVSEKKTIGFENENHRFLSSKSNKNDKSNKNSEYECEYVSSNKNSNLSDNNIPTTDMILSELKTTYYMTDSEASDVSESFYDFNAKRDWSSLETRSWQSLLKQFVGRDKRFTDDILSARKEEAEREAAEERIAREKAEKYRDYCVYPDESVESFVDYIRRGKPSEQDEVIKQNFNDFFSDDELAELWTDTTVYIENYGNHTTCPVYWNYECSPDFLCGFNDEVYKQSENELFQRIREHFNVDGTLKAKTTVA